MIAKNEDNVSIQDFTKLDVAVGTILEASQNIKAKKPAYILKIDFGQNIGIKSTSAQITNYSIDELIGRQIVGICNLPSKNIAGFVSEVLVLGAVLGEEVHLLRTDNKLENGTLVG
jgi:tRNA-binding protein